MNIKCNLYPGGRTKALTMSYDDGNIADRKLVEIFNKFGIKGTFHLNSGFFGTGDYIRKDEIAELFKGHEISVHTVTHPFLQNVPIQKMIEEVSEDRKNLEEISNYLVTGMSYPFGTYNEDVLKVLSMLGIEYSRTTASHGNFNLPENFLTWHPTCHHNGNINELGQRLIDSKYKNLSLLYVWGHSFEFNRQDNWQIIEEFCELMANKEEIWYATNIEICHYIKAMKGLQFSADMKMVSNPSALSIWISVDDKPVEIPSGSYNMKL